jgi:hypothetical protein
MGKFKVLSFLFLSFFACCYTSYSQDKPNLTETGSSISSNPVSPPKNSTNNSYKNFIESYLFNHTKRLDELKESGYYSPQLLSALEVNNLALGCISPSFVMLEYKDIFRTISEKKNANSRFNSVPPAINNIYSVEEVNKYLVSCTNSSSLTKDSIEAVNKYLANFQTIEQIKSHHLFKEILSKTKDSYYEDRAVAYTLIMIYLNRIVEFEIGINHTFFILDLLSKNTFTKAYLFDDTSNEKIKLFWKKQYLKLIYGYWLEGFDISDPVRNRLNGNTIGSYCGNLNYYELLVTSFYVFDAIRTDNPDFKQVIDWIANNYSDFVKSSDKLFLSLPSTPSFEDDDLGTICQFTFLNIFKSNGIYNIRNAYLGGKQYASIGIDEFKKMLLNKLETNTIIYSIETKTTNTCIKSEKSNFTIRYEPLVLFNKLKQTELNRIEKKFVFNEVGNEVFLMQKNGTVANQSSSDIKITKFEKFSKADILFYYIFQRSRNTNFAVLSNSLKEVSDSLKIYNQRRFIAIGSPLIQHFNLDSTKKNQLLKHFVNTATSNYNSIYMDKKSNPNNTIIADYLIKVENDAMVSNDSVAVILSQYLNSIIQSSIPSKPLEKIKQEFILYFDNVYNSSIKKNLKENITLFGDVSYNSPQNVFPGSSTLTINLDAKATLSLVIYVNGEPIRKYLSGKVVRTSNGLYQFSSPESLFNFRFNVDQCGNMDLELAGTANNSNIKSKFVIKL